MRDCVLYHLRIFRDYGHPSRGQGLAPICDGTARRGRHWLSTDEGPGRLGLHRAAARKPHFWVGHSQHITPKSNGTLGIASAAQILNDARLLPPP